MTSRSSRLVLGIGGVLIASLALAGAAVGAPTDASAQVARLRDLELARQQALVDADVATLEPILADDFVLVPPPGIPLTKDEYLGAVAGGAIDYAAFEPVSPIEVRYYGQAAVLTYRSYIDVVVAGLGAFQTEAWHTYVFERRDGQWQVVREQATSVGGFPPP